MHPMKRWLATVSTLDIRALALFRVGLALVVLLDLAVRLSTWEAHYSDFGVLTAARAAVREPLGHWSLYQLWPDGVLLGCMVQAAAAIALLVGWKTRAATVVVWLLLVSLHGRNSLVLNGGDHLLRILLFWAAWLPLGAVAAADPQGSPPREVRSVVSFALVAQVCLVYLVTMAMKTDPAWWNGSAAGQVLQLDLFTTDLGLWLREQTSLHPVLTWMTAIGELLGVALALSPWRNQITRSLAVAGFFVMHLGFGLLLELGMFPWVSICSWLPLIPGPVFDRLGWTLQDASDPVQPRAGTRLAAGALLVITVLWNVRTLSPPVQVLPHAVDPVWRALYLDQQWNMFAPGPPSSDGWYVFTGTTERGEVDLWRMRDQVDHRKPEQVLRSVGSRRWGKYLSTVRRPKDMHELPELGGYLQRRWEREMGGEVTDVRLVFWREAPLAPHEVGPREIVLWQGDPRTAEPITPPRDPVEALERALQEKLRRQRDH